MLPDKLSGNWITTSVDALRIYYNLCIIKYLLDIISPNNELSTKLVDLFNHFPEVDLAAMGFPASWREEPLWR